MDVLIKKPYLEKVNIGRTRVCSRIDEDEKSYVIWYEVEDEYAKYLSSERVDAFLVALLPHFMAKPNTREALCIKAEGKLSEQLYYQLKQYYIPSLSKFTKMYNYVEIVASCEKGTNQLRGNVVGTGISGGVDSFYTLLMHNKECEEGRKVTHGLYCNTGMFGGYDGEGEKRLIEHSKSICDEMGIEFIEITSNICKDIYKALHAAIISPMFMSFSMALQELFSIYYHSSETPFSMFALYPHNSERYDLLNVHCFSTENLQYYSAGSETNRIGKIEYISQFEIVKKKLIVCAGHSQTEKFGEYLNCGRCSKCTYTMLQMEALGVLDSYNKVFEVEKFRKDPNYYYGYFYYKGKKDIFKKETLDEFKRQGKRIGLGARIRGIGKIVKNGFRRENPFAESYRP